MWRRKRSWTQITRSSNFLPNLCLSEYFDTSNAFNRNFLVNSSFVCLHYTSIRQQEQSQCLLKIFKGWDKYGRFKVKFGRNFAKEIKFVFLYITKSFKWIMKNLTNFDFCLINHSKQRLLPFLLLIKPLLSPLCSLSSFSMYDYNTRSILLPFHFFSYLILLCV